MTIYKCADNCNEEATHLIANRDRSMKYDMCKNHHDYWVNGSGEFISLGTIYPPAYKTREEFFNELDM